MTLATKENWDEYVRSTPNGEFGEYLQATEDIVACVEDMLQEISSLEEFKKNMVAFCSERKEFLVYANANCP